MADPLIAVGNDVYTIIIEFLDHFDARALARTNKEHYVAVARVIYRILNIDKAIDPFIADGLIRRRELKTFVRAFPRTVCQVLIDIFDNDGTNKLPPYVGLCRRNDCTVCRIQCCRCGEAIMSAGSVICGEMPAQDISVPYFGGNILVSMYNGNLFKVFGDGCHKQAIMVPLPLALRSAMAKTMDAYKHFVSRSLFLQYHKDIVADVIEATQRRDGCIDTDWIHRCKLRTIKRILQCHSTYGAVMCLHGDKRMNDAINHMRDIYNRFRTRISES